MIYHLLSNERKLSVGRKLLSNASIGAFIIAAPIWASSAWSMDLDQAVKIALESNPEIAEAAANRRAIDFEYEQARRLNNPSLILEGRAGPEWVDSRTTRLLGNDDEVLFGRQASATFQKNLLSFGRNNAERDRQATRVDSAAHRVRERSELVSLDVVQSYLDVMRLREIVDLADQNVAFHETKVSDISRSVSGGIKSESDSQQARERLSAAKISRSETEEAIDIAQSDFRRVVGLDIGQTKMPSSISSKVPATLAAALGDARVNNPTLIIAKTDLDTARAQYRAAKADLKPELLFEVVGRHGDDIGGFSDYSTDVRAQMRLRYEFRGGIKSSVVQEQINRVDEARARIMSLERNVESLVREAWATRNRTSLRVQDLTAQVNEGTNLLDSYTREFSISRRTLLDILDAEASLFQAQTSLATARYADVYAQYRILAATGDLLNAFGVSAPREADTSLMALEKVEPTPLADTEPRRYPKHFNETMGNADYVSVAAIEIINEKNAVDIASVKVRPIMRQTASPVEANDAMAAMDAHVSFEPSPAIVVTEKKDAPQVMAATQTQPKPVPMSEMAVEIYSDAPQTESLQDTVWKPYSGEITPIDESELAPAAYDENALAPAKYPSAYKVVTGDTLYSIAKKSEKSVAEIKRINDLADNTITVGEIIYMSSDAKDAAKILPITVAETPREIAQSAPPILSTPSSDALDIDTMIDNEVIKVDQQKFEALLDQDGAKHYPGMKAIIVDQTTYLLDI